jgi:hypothetical protein
MTGFKSVAKDEIFVGSVGGQTDSSTCSKTKGAIHSRLFFDAFG